MSITPERLYAYLDGELDAAACREVEAALAADPALAAELAAQRRLREQLHEALGPVLDEPVPERLRAMARPVDAGATVVDLAARRAARRSWRWPATGMGMAAAVALGVLLVPLLRTDPALLAGSDGRLLARGELRQALEQGRSGERFGDAVPGFAFRDRAGGYCRSFIIRGAPARAGLSCRDGDEWRVEVLAETVLPEGELRLAATGLPVDVLEAIDDRIDGEPLDATAEAEALRRGWR
ncbi:MAG: zf-HC2 domain-containing protein [Silanimonas lenta]